MKLIEFTLCAPLMSWGDHGRWDRRDTSSMPTKSAVIGMLGCCLGFPRGDARLAELTDKLHVAVRADKAGSVMLDFHTVQGTGGVLLNAEGKKRSGNTIITPKQYLQDACFTVFLWGDEDALAQCEHAMRHPHWIPYLGRRSCVPTKPIIPKWIEAQSVDEAIFNTDGKGAVQAQIEIVPGMSVSSNDNVIERRDEPVRADLNQYGVRSVRVPHGAKAGVTK